MHLQDRPIEDEINPITFTKTLSYFTKERFKSQIERIKQASEQAQKSCMLFQLLKSFYERNS
jgi:hypothetical protein